MEKQTNSSLKISSPGVESSNTHSDLFLATSETTKSDIESTNAPIEIKSPISGTTVGQAKFYTE